MPVKNDKAKDLLHIGLRWLKNAVSAEEKGDINSAYNHYKKSLAYFEKASRAPDISRRIFDKQIKIPDIEYNGRNCGDRISKFKAHALERINSLDPRVSSSTSSQSDSRCNAKELILAKFKDSDKSILARILDEIYDVSEQVGFDDIGGNEKAKKILHEVVIYPTLRPELFTGLRSPTRGVLLFGPPGNGKTMLAKAVAYESKSIFFNVSSATLLSKWVGESENAVRLLFRVARELQPVVLFFDEIDALMAARQSSSRNEAARRVLSQLLTEIDGIGSASDRLLVLGATNRPTELDDAAIRRFPKRIYIGMPDSGTRLTIIKKLLARETSHSLSAGDFNKLTNLTKGYSASDLTQLTKDAALGPIRDLDSSQLQTISISSIRPLKLQDFVASLQNVRPSLNSASLAYFKEWASEFNAVGLDVIETAAAGDESAISQS